MSYLIIFVIIGLLILVHELGHYLAARVVGIPIARFSIGFGPLLWSYTRGKTEYGIGWFPLGGYVLPDLEDDDHYFRIPVRHRILFALGGPVANLLLAVPLFAIMNVCMVGFSWTAVTIAPIQQTFGALAHIAMAFTQLFESPEHLSGVVGIVAQGEQFVGGSVVKAIQFSILLSLNLAIFNMLPVPALDGGKILLALAEKLHPKARALQLPLALAGWVCLIALLIYATAMDVDRWILG